MRVSSPGPTARLALCLTLLGAACGGGDEPAEGVIVCDSATDCPASWVCRSADGRCWRGDDAAPGEGDACFVGQCAEGSLCVMAFTGEAAVCRRICETRSDCPGGLSSCFIRVGDRFLCSVDCDPLALPPAASGCGAGSLCAVRHAGVEVAEPIIDCIAQIEPVAASGAPCDGTAQCGAGHVCAGGVCRRRCVIGDGSACGPAETCDLLSPREHDDSVEFGACLP